MPFLPAQHHLLRAPDVPFWPGSRLSPCSTASWLVQTHSNSYRTGSVIRHLGQYTSRQLLDRLGCLLIKKRVEVVVNINDTNT